MCAVALLLVIFVSANNNLTGAAVGLPVEKPSEVSDPLENNDEITNTVEESTRENKLSKEFVTNLQPDIIENSNSRSEISLFVPEEDTIIDFKSKKRDFPNNVIKRSEEYIESIVSEDDYENYIRFDKGLIIQDPNGDEQKYVFMYDFLVRSYRENGKETRKIYTIQVIVDEDGNILDQIKPANRYNYFKMRE